MTLASIKASAFNLTSVLPAAVPNGSIFLDASNSDALSIKTMGGVVVPIGSSTPPTTADYFTDYVNGVTSATVTSPDAYNPGTFRLSVYRNGIRLINSVSTNGASGRYQELSATSVTLGLAPVTTDATMFINRGANVAYSNIITGVTGTMITIPSYTMGDKSLMVWRNGLLLNTSGLDTTADQYTETSNTVITLGAAAVSTDVFLVESITAPAFRADMTGLTGNVLGVGGSYVDGSKKLLVFRNGMLMANATNVSGILSAVDRYQETSTTQVTVELAAALSDVWSFIGQ